MSKQKITLLENIKDEIIEEKFIPPTDLELSQLYQNTYDLTLPEKYRLECLSCYCQNHPEESANVINKLNSMFLYSYSKLIESYLYNICILTDIDISLRLESAKCLSWNSEKGFIALDILCSQFDEITLSTTLKVDAVITLMNNEKFKDKSLKYFYKIINDNNIDPLFRYKTIQSLDIKLEKKEDIIYFSRCSCLSFLKNEKNPIRYRILACQYLLRKCEIDASLKSYIEETLISFAKDDQLDVNVRADAVDVILQSGSDEARKIASQLIILLGTMGSISKTVFDNSQNVHHQAIEESANKILEFLNVVPTKNSEGGEIEFDAVRKGILDHLETKKDVIKEYKDYKERVEAALTRIYIDRALYSQYNMSLVMILIKMWCYISKNEYFESMRDRLIEELYDSSDVCSTGYAFRIVNVISGFGELSIGISFEDQIVANMAAALNKKIGEIEDEDYQSEIINQMIIPVYQYDLRGKFLKFFREHISKIREDMFQEFKDFMSDTDYDLYFRKAIMNYEGMN